MTGVAEAPPRVTVVVPTFRRRGSVERLLAALDAQEPRGGFEVVVVVDGSDDGTLEAVRDRTAPYPLRAVWQPNAGRAAACNRGIAEARGALVLLLDDDMEPDPGCVAAHVARHAAPASGLAVIGAVPVALPPRAGGASRFIARRFDHHLAALAEPGRAIGPRDFFSGHLSVGAADLQGAGGFDDGFRVYGSEDIDLYLRLVERDVDVVYAPEARARQRYEKDGRGLVDDSLAKGATAVQLALKHPRAARSTRIATWADAAPRRRALRSAAVGAIARVPPLRALLRAAGAVAERAPDPLAGALLDLATDLAFWAGAHAELRRRGLAGRQVADVRGWSQRVGAAS